MSMPSCRTRTTLHRCCCSRSWRSRSLSPLSARGPGLWEGHMPPPSSWVSTNPPPSSPRPSSGHAAVTNQQLHICAQVAQVCFQYSTYKTIGGQMLSQHYTTTAFTSCLLSNGPGILEVLTAVYTHTERPQPDDFTSGGGHTRSNPN